MSRTNSILLFLLLANTLIAVGVFVYSFFCRKGRRMLFMLFSLLILLCPVIMPCFLGIGRILDILSRSREVDMNEISFDKTREKGVENPDSAAEMNYVSLREAMLLSDTKSLRRLLIDILKYNAGSTLKSVAFAMNSEDSETAHYAAASVSDALGEFRNTTQNLLLRMRDYPEDVEVNLTLFDHMYQGLKLEIMADSEQRSYTHTLDAVGENLFTHNVWFMSASHYLCLVDRMIAIEDYELAEKWAARAQHYRPNELETYKARLKLFYERHQSLEFFECLEAFKQSNIAADQEMLELIRLYK